MARVRRVLRDGARPRAPSAIADVMPGKAPLWDRIVKKHGLRPTACERGAILSCGDYVFSPEYDIMSDATKARQHGFHEAPTTGEMFIDLLGHYRRGGFIP